LDENKFRRTIYESKHRVVRATTSQVQKFVREAQAVLSKEMEILKPQAWNPNEKARSVFKVFDEQNNYKCTGTLVGGRMYVVAHVLSEDITAKYYARNHVHSLELLAKEAIIINPEIIAFKVRGIPSEFKNSHFKVLRDAGIVTIFGFGMGLSSTPDAIVGFASPLGWCNAKTRCGDCTSPVLDECGNIVGFWTHGNGISFGRFEPITDIFIADLKEITALETHNHVGLDFPLRLPSL